MKKEWTFKRFLKWMSEHRIGHWELQGGFIYEIDMVDAR